MYYFNWGVPVKRNLRTIMCVNSGKLVGYGRYQGHIIILMGEVNREQ